jgi:hypothetical protein
MGSSADSISRAGACEQIRGTRVCCKAISAPRGTRVEDIQIRICVCEAEERGNEEGKGDDDAVDHGGATNMPTEGRSIVILEELAYRTALVCLILRED